MAALTHKKGSTFLQQAALQVGEHSQVPLMPRALVALMETK
jgi:hypothetical protein